ncbi:MAG: Arm DNA-binding domain-containing protein [Alphaproteobacteria bacterium]|nr:Arm DNA-binding domain-containing protein [Alphaproteobacteria bacterium]
MRLFTRDFWDTALPGFGFRLIDKGRKSWVLIYRTRGRQRRFTIGRYPALTLAEAREEARTALHAIETGIDPAEQTHEFLIPNHKKSQLIHMN